MDALRIRVGAGQEADFASIGKAIEALGRVREAGDGREATILLEPGVYREKVFLDLPDVELRGLGKDPAETTISWGDYAKLPAPDGRPMRTFNTATFYALADRLKVENLTIENDAGLGEKVGQAVAAYVDADEVLFSRCRLQGRQDTLFTGPLPPTPIEGKDFGGPRDSGPGRISRKASGSPAVGRQRYEDCYIEGDIDFIFGSAEAVFRGCEIRSLDLGRGPGRGVNGWVSAASTPERGLALPTPAEYSGDPSLGGWLRGDEVDALAELARISSASLPPIGHFFYRCRLTCEEGMAERSVYLGRPWRDWARSLYAYCELGPHIAAEGWDDWGKVAARQRVVYAELGCAGAGADRSGRVSWSHGD